VERGRNSFIPAKRDKGKKKTETKEREKEKADTSQGEGGDAFPLSEKRGGETVEKERPANGRRKGKKKGSRLASPKKKKKKKGSISYSTGGTTSQ